METIPVIARGRGGWNYLMTGPLVEALDEAMEGIMAGGPAAIMFSGGLDSGLLALLAGRHGVPRLYTVGLKGSHDMLMSEEAAMSLGLPWSPLVLAPEDIIDACRELLRNVRIASPVTLSFELPLHIISSRAEEGMLISGQGADELFGGYARYLEMSAEDALRSMSDDLVKLLGEIIPLEDTIASRYLKRVGRPFLDTQVRKIAASMPVAEKIQGGVRKVPLRSAARSLGSELIASREKKAAQYGSGLMKVLRSRARREKLSLEEYLACLAREQYS